MLWMSGLGHNDLQINTQTWYISAMLLSILILYPILLRNFDLFTRVIAPAAALFLFGWIAQEYGTLNLYRSWTGITYSGILRAAASLCLGSVCWAAAQSIRRIPFTKAGRLQLSLIEIVSYSLVVVAANLPKQKMLACLCVALLAVGVTIMSSKSSLTSSIFDRSVYYLLGNFSLTLYLNHIIIRKIFQKNDLGLSYMQDLLIFVVAALAWSVVAHFLVQWLQKRGQKIAAKLKPWFIQT